MKASGRFKIMDSGPDDALWGKQFLEKGDIAKRKDFNGGYYKQLFGIIAQKLVCEELGLPEPANTGEFDGGVDFEWAGKKWDVKCEIRNSYFKQGFVHNLSAFQINYDCDGYVFVNYNKSMGCYEITGWILKEDLKTNAKFIQKGTKIIRTDETFFHAYCSFYELQPKFLKKWEDFPELLKA